MAMEEMEVDLELNLDSDLDIDGPDMEIDQDRCHRAVQKLNKRLGAEQGDARPEPSMSYTQARDMLRNLGDLYTGNKITVDNAFDLHGIDALRTVIFCDNVTASARCGEGHFQSAGFGLDISMKIYGKRVDAVYNLAYKSFIPEKKQQARNDDDTGDDGRDQEEKGATRGDDGEDGSCAATSGGKTKKRQAAANVGATLKDNSELRQQVKEATFDTDPFFVRTSRLIDENSPQGLLLHNLPVLSGYDVTFDADVRPQELMARAQADAAAEAVGDVMIDLTVLSGTRELLAAASSASISPGIKELYDLLQAQPNLPGIKVATRVEPQELLHSALADNKRAQVEAQRNEAVRQVVRQVEDAMDVDTADVGGDDDGAGVCDDDAGPAFSPDGDGGDDDGYASPGFDARADTDDESPLSGGGTASGGGDDFDDSHQYVSRRDHCDDDVPDRDCSDDESALLSLLGRTAGSALGSSVTLQRTWWRSLARKTASSSAAGAKPRTRKPKPEAVSVDWRAAASEPQLEEVHLHTYKTARRDATAKLCLPQEEPVRVEDLCSYLSCVPVTAACGFSIAGCGSLNTHGLGGSAGCAMTVHETWRSLLIADNLRARQLRRGVRAAGPTHGVATPGPGRQGMGGPALSGTDGQYGEAVGEEYGSGTYDSNQDAYDDAGAPDVGGGDISDDDQDDGGCAFQGPGRGGWALTLEELLQPPRCIQHLTIKCDKTAGVADVASLKLNIEDSLKHLAVDVQHRRQSAPAAQPVLSFQTVLDQVSAHVASATAKAPTKEPGTSAAGTGATAGPLAGVSSHLAFICLLHLANEKGLALDNGGNMDTLMITGLGDLVAAR